MTKVKYPIGIQSFEEIIRGGYVYVDKTERIFNLTSEGKYYFLSRPRRFGKSLLQSTIEALFEGKRELFKGLAIDSMDYDWEVHPVFHLDLNAMDYTQDDSLLQIIQESLEEWERKYGIEPQFDDISLRFKNVIIAAKEQTGKNVVILIDEYDKPLIMNLNNMERQERFRNMLKGFYGVLKSCDQHIRFALLTGVTKFGRVSVFSDLNNLRDISMLPQYHEICGISESELTKYFEEEIHALAEFNEMSVEEAKRELKRCYDGYHFSEYAKEGLYNPMSILNVLQDRIFNDYWFNTATPTLLVEILKKTDTDISTLDGSECLQSDLMGLDPAFKNPIPLIYQTGYLTIKGYDKRSKLYRLGYPNEEVERAFLNYLLPYYAGWKNERAYNIFKLIDAIEADDVDLFMKTIRSFMADMPYDHATKKVSEGRLHDVVYIICKLMGLELRTEYHTSTGRIDMVIFTKTKIYIIEFKLETGPVDALDQIDRLDYALAFQSDGRPIINVGVSFSSQTRNISAWQVEPLKN